LSFCGGLLVVLSAAKDLLFGTQSITAAPSLRSG
jgi:hypothetical protein